ncbi:uncharacterized protein LOC132919011 [Rhopalosiphum padi]|uniref:uncharacterized protein LOC132919011 n=1 Tax=Rhopalosiphum padi TaxID=40932 RepID=UPI00298E7F66|nr:uncharacterized protein LOC132919011 [Rhopalosiphum padi]
MFVKKIHATTKLSPKEKFRIESFISVVDQLIVSLTERIGAYETICQRFGFLNKIEKLETSELQSAANYLVSIYSNDLESSLGNELIQFGSFVKIYIETRKDNEQWEMFLYRIIEENNLQCTFPNIEVVLRIYLVLMVSNCSGERSFSKMKLIKNRLRTSMTQRRLSELALLSIESDILRSLDFSQVVEKFAATKSRKVII